MTPPRLHGDARHSGGLGQRLPQQLGSAVGILSTLALAPLPASNGVSDLARALAYARAHGGPAVSLVPGTEPFAGTSRILSILG